MAYGIEITADNGNPFILPNESLFTFAQKITTVVSSGNRQVVPTLVPDSANVLVFARQSGGSAALTISPVRIGGVWNLQYVTQSYSSTITLTQEFYIFADRILKNSVPGDYGFFAYDAGGVEIYNTNAKLLKTERVPIGLPTSWPSPFTPVRVSKKYACLCSVFALLGRQYNFEEDQTFAVSWAAMTFGGAHYIGANNLGLWFKNIVGQGAVHLVRGNRECLVIDCALYD